MLTIHRHRATLYLKASTFPLTSLSPNPNPNPFSHHYPSPFSPHFSTKTSDSTSFALSYLIHKFNFSPQFASKLCSTYRLRFKTTQNPESVITFFKTHNFSDSQLRHTIEKAPWLLSCNPSKRVLPKFQFFLSKGASNSDIVNLVSKYPVVLSASLEKKIVPAYELVYRFLQSDKDTFTVLNYNPTCFGESRVVHNIRVLVEIGVTDSNIARLLRSQFKLFHISHIPLLVEELKHLGFHPSKSIFSIALIAKTSVPKTRWKAKVDAFKKWGWSDEDVLEAFRNQPHCMLTSVDKINLVMSFWVNQLGWDALALAKVPRVFGASLERRIIPRASVVHYLWKNGLLKRNASLTSPFVMNEKRFLEMYISRFKEESSYLLKLYEEKLNLAHNKDKFSGSHNYAIKTAD